MTKRSGTLAAITIVCILAGVYQLFAADGDPDPTFGTSGIVRRVQNGLGEAQAVSIQSDGKIVVVAAKDDAFAVLRYNTDGTRDLNFGTNGEAVISFGPATTSVPHGVAIQSNGKIVIAGSTEKGQNPMNFALARLTKDGMLDTAFGNQGLVQTNFDNGNDQANAIAIQSDGRIVLAGSASFPEGLKFALARYQKDGSLDATFSGNGKTAIGWGGGRNIASAVNIQADGNILAVGETDLPDSNGVVRTYFALARFRHDDGRLDPTFSSNGRQITSFSVSGLFAASGALAEAIQPDGKIVVTGWSTLIATYPVARYNSDGSLDATFGNGGKTTTRVALTPGGGANADGIAVVNDDIIVAGTTNETLCGGTPEGIALVRYASDGSPDPGFGGDGIVNFNPYLDDCSGGITANSLAVQQDGKLMIAGGDSNGHNQALTLVRFNN